ncbi:MAG: hypothetical protein ACRCUE_19815 [Bosea sp. (in: a-proteobacteria)]
MDDLTRAVAPGLTQPFDPDNEAGGGPGLIEPCRNGVHGDAACLDPAMTMIDVLGAPQIRRIERVVRLIRTTGEP